MKMKPGRIRNPNELIKVLNEIKYLVSNNEIQFVPNETESWDFHNEIIIEGQWPDFFTNRYYDRTKETNYILSCDTYHGNCKIRKETNGENLKSRFFGLFK